MTWRPLTLCWLLTSACTAADADKAVDTDVDTDGLVDSDEPADSDTLVVDTDDSDVATDVPVDTGDTDTDLPEDPCLARRARMTVGAGEDAFEPLVAEQDVTMVKGPQGGWHIVTSFTARNVLRLLAVTYKVTDVATGTILHDVDQNLLMLTDDPTWMCNGYALNHQSVLPDELTIDAVTGTPPEVLCGRLVELDVTIKVHDKFPGTIAGDVLVQDSVIVRAQPDPIDGPACLP